MEGKDKFQLSTNTAFYLLKHFTEITSVEQHELCNAGKLLSEINQKLKFVGSKFNHQNISGYYHLLELINTKNANMIIQQSNGRKAYIYEFDMIIGTDSIFPILALTEYQKSQIEKVERDGVFIRTFKGEALHTKQLVLIAEGSLVITCYPGTFAPPLPNNSMENELLRECNEFWDNHLFVITEK